MQINKQQVHQIAAMLGDDPDTILENTGFGLIDPQRAQGNEFVYSAYVPLLADLQPNDPRQLVATVEYTLVYELEGSHMPQTNEDPGDEPTAYIYGASDVNISKLKRVDGQPAQPPAGLDLTQVALTYFERHLMDKAEQEIIETETDPNKDLDPNDFDNLGRSLYDHNDY